MAAFVFQIQTPKDEGPFTRYYALQNANDSTTDVLICQTTKEMVTKLNDATKTDEKQYLRNQTTEDEGPLTKEYFLRNTNDSRTDALICPLVKEMVTQLNDVNQAGSKCSFNVSDPRANLRTCSSLFETDDVYSRSVEQS